MSDKHAFDVDLAKSMYIILKDMDIKSLYDFGCGNGKYVEFFNKNGIKSIGFDGNPITEKFNNCKVLDLAYPIFLEKSECIISLETGEHIPQEYENEFITNIDKSLKKRGILIISWAIPGQQGYGHFNERDNDYIKSLFSKRGYTILAMEEIELRQNASLPWFKNTIMVFMKT